MLADRLTRPVLLRLKGRDWPILYTHDVLLDIEHASGLNVMAGDFNIYRPRAATFRVALWAVLRRTDPQIKLEEVGTLVNTSSRSRIHSALIDGWILSMPEATPPEDEVAAETVPAKTWVEAWAIARNRLRVTDQEWLDMTPRMLQELSRMELETTRQREAMFSRLTATTINWSAHPPKTAIDGDAFMLHPYKKPTVTAMPITGEYLSAVIG